ncbi:hypothetical protein [Fibrivirga algicola]|uniref:hypothetical protein n=1 Tax=Fibrivirga algicola TaxID=2950420 RepID=UPI0012F9AC31|nr:hypothetical protein [Fibrivirga algicola]
MTNKIASGKVVIYLPNVINKGISQTHMIRNLLCLSLLVTYPGLLFGKRTSTVLPIITHFPQP